MPNGDLEHGQVVEDECPDFCQGHRTVPARAAPKDDGEVVHAGR